MTFAQREESRHQGQPVDLYHFRFGTAPNAYYAYTDAEVPVMHGGVTYLPIPISRSAVTASGTLDKSAMKIKLPINTQIAELFRVYPPSQVVTLIMRQGHIGDPEGDFLVHWTGRVLGSDREGSECELNCEPIAASMRRTGLRRHYQIGCPHVLYGKRCRANKELATIRRDALTVSGNTVDLALGWNGALSPAKYIGGLLEWDGPNGPEARTILRVIDNVKLYLSGPTTNLLSGTEVRVVLGCNHQQTDCNALHANIHNYGGQPYIPTKNPINTNPFS